MTGEGEKGRGGDRASGRLGEGEKGRTGERAREKMEAVTMTITRYIAHNQFFVPSPRRSVAPSPRRPVAPSLLGLS